jgi:hypothetical protein
VPGGNSKKSGAAAASNLQIGASGTLLQDSVISIGRLLRNGTFAGNGHPSKGPARTLMSGGNSKESGAAAASNLQVGASGTLLQDSVISIGRPLRNDTKNCWFSRHISSGRPLRNGTKNCRSSRHIFTGRHLNSDTKNRKSCCHIFSPSQQSGGDLSVLLPRQQSGTTLSPNQQSGTYQIPSQQKSQ